MDGIRKLDRHAAIGDLANAYAARQKSRHLLKRMRSRPLAPGWQEVQRASGAGGIAAPAVTRVNIPYAPRYIRRIPIQVVDSEEPFYRELFLEFTDWLSNYWKTTVQTLGIMAVIFVGLFLYRAVPRVVNNASLPSVASSNLVSSQPIHLAPANVSLAQTGTTNIGASTTSSTTSGQESTGSMYGGAPGRGGGTTTSSGQTTTSSGSSTTSSSGSSGSSSSAEPTVSAGGNSISITPNTGLLDTVLTSAGHLLQ